MTSLDNIRIARVSTVAFFVADQLKDQIETLVARGAEVTIITSGGPDISRFALGERLKNIDIEIPRSLHPLKDLKALFRLMRVFRQSNFNIVHSTTPKAGLLCAIAGFICRVPVRIHTFTGQPWVTLRGPLAASSRFADRIIGVLNTRCYADSASQMRFLIGEGIIGGNNIDVLSNGSIAGVDLKRFDRTRFSESERRKIRAELGIKDGARVILFLGRVCIDKGIAELIGAFRDLSSTGVDADLVLVGPVEQKSGDDSWLNSLTQGVERIHRVGHTEIPERYMAIADVLCLPSYREGFGTVVIEAASMGVPAVATDIYGLSDAIVNGETGVLVPVKQVEPLASALLHLLQSPDMLKEMAKAARARCEAQFDSRDVSEDLVGEYRRLLALDAQ